MRRPILIDLSETIFLVLGFTLIGILIGVAI